MIEHLYTLYNAMVIQADLNKFVDYIPTYYVRKDLLSLDKEDQNYYVGCKTFPLDNLPG